MPANKKYLIQSIWIRWSKILAAILGGMVASVSMHMVLAIYIGYEWIIPTSLFSIFIMWGFFMVMVYWIQKAWLSWLILIGISLLSIGLIYLTKI